MRGVLFGTGLAAALLVPMGAAAQAGADDGGLMLGGYFNGITLTVAGGEVEHGPGGAVLVGYGVTGRITAYANLAAARAARAEAEGGDYTIAHADLGARVSFGSGLPFLFPYMSAAVTGTSARVSAGGVDRTASGAGITLGSGVSFRASPSTSVEAGLQITLGALNLGTPEGAAEPAERTLDYRSGRFQVGVAYRP